MFTRCVVNGTNMRSIMHFCMDSFCASLEQLKKPELAGKPVIVVHDSGRGQVVVSASKEAAAEGVRESMTARHAGRYCPDAVFLPANWSIYREASDTVMDILSVFSPLLEPQGLDRAYMDVTGCFSLFGSPESIAAEAQRRVEKEIGVAVSVGIAKNKLVSGAASSAAGPCGCLEVEPGLEREFLYPLPVGYLRGIGPKIERRLLNLGVRTVGELAAIPERLLIRQFGVLGSRLHSLSHGVDHSPVMALYPPAMLSIEHTFVYGAEELCDPELAEPYLLWMCDRLAIRLRKRAEQASTVAVEMEFEGLPAVSRSYTLKTPVSTAHGLYTGARRILWSEMRGAGIRSLRLTLSGLSPGGGIQLSFMGDTERRMKLDAVVESIRARFGEHAIAYGAAS